MDLGRIASLEKDHKAVDVARKGDAVAMKIEVRLVALHWAGLGWASLASCAVPPWCFWAMLPCRQARCGHKPGPLPACPQAAAGSARCLAARPLAAAQHAPPPPTAVLHPACIPRCRTHLPQATKPEEASRSYERHFDHRDELVSRIT